MRLRSARRLLILAGSLVAGIVAADGVSSVDDRGVRVALAAPARHIVALAPSITELVYAAGAGAKLIGVPPRTTTSSRTGRVQAGHVTAAPRTRC